MEDPYTKHHDLTDDLEYVLHIMTWTLMRYSESTLRGFDLALFLHIYDEQVNDLTDPIHSGGRVLKADKLGCPGRYLPKNIAFETRPGLSSCIQDIAHLFLPLYTLEEYRTSEQEE